MQAIIEGELGWDKSVGATCHQVGSMGSHSSISPNTLAVQDCTSAIGSKRCGNILGLGILRQEATSRCFGFYGHLSIPTLIGPGTTAYTKDWVAASQLVAGG